MKYIQLLADTDFIEKANEIWMSGRYRMKYKVTFTYPALTPQEAQALRETIESMHFDIETVVFLAQYCGFHESFLNFLQRWQPQYDIVITATKTIIRGENKAEQYIMAAFFETYFEGRKVGYKG
jgi:nicotinic acid phosphoribosyltransferase